MFKLNKRIIWIKKKAFNSRRWRSLWVFSYQKDQEIFVITKCFDSSDSRWTYTTDVIFFCPAKNKTNQIWIHENRIDNLRKMGCRSMKIAKWRIELKVL